MNDKRASQQNPPKPTIITDQRARGAIINGRVIIVLVVSMLLAGIAMVLLLTYFLD